MYEEFLSKVSILGESVHVVHIMKTDFPLRFTVYFCIPEQSGARHVLADGRICVPCIHFEHRVRRSQSAGG